MEGNNNLIGADVSNSLVSNKRGIKPLSSFGSIYDLRNPKKICTISGSFDYFDN